MSRSAKVTVVGADGFVGSELAAGLDAKRVVYGEVRNGEISVGDAGQILLDSEVIINAGGFRVRPGCTYADYKRSHQVATSLLVPFISPGACLIHISSASVLGKSKRDKLGCGTPADPASFPSAAYARAKLEADEYLRQVAAAKGFQLILIRPAVIYSPQGAGMMGTLLRLARRGICLRIYPARARHHFCHMDLLLEVVRQVIARRVSLADHCFVVADPYTVTNEGLSEMINRYQRNGHVTVPMPVHWLHNVLRWAPHSSNPSLDFKTWSEVFGVLNLDTVYDPSPTFRLLEIDPESYTLEKKLQPLIHQSLAA